MSALSLAGVTVDFGAVRAVNKVDMTLQAGEICALVGPNGSGKSTLLNTISAFIPIDEGAIALGEQDISRDGPHTVARLGVGRTFQLIRLLHGLSVEENVIAGCFPMAERAGIGYLLRSLARPRHLSEDERANVHEAMRRAGVEGLGGVLVEELSFGYQRRVEIARAIVSNPSLLLLDEPAAGLGGQDLEDLAALIRSEAERGCAVILVDHHLEFVLELCPRVVVLNLGSKIFDGASNLATEDQTVREAYVGV